MENRELPHNPEKNDKQEKLPAIFNHIVNNIFQVVDAILEKSVSEKFLEKYSIKDFKTMVRENLNRGAIDEKQANELLSRPDFIEEYDDFINKFQKSFLDQKLDENREELTEEMNNILNKIEE
jgi:ERCC4-related helicase